MNRKYRGEYESPLECFRENYDGKKITRWQLAKEDKSLCESLRYWKQLDEAIPEKNVRKYRGKYDSPIECYRSNFGDKKMTRVKLQKEDPGLADALRRWEQLDEAIPERRVSRDFKGNPLAYFKKHYKGRKMTIKKLCKEDVSLYESLRYWEQLDEAFPERRVSRDFGRGPLFYFKEHYGRRKMTRSQLLAEDSSLYSGLVRTKTLDKAIPEPERRFFHGNPLAYFREKYEGRKIRRTQLYKEDSSLYSSLQRAKQLDEAIPEKKEYRGYPSPLDCFRAKYKGKKITRKQLAKEDSCLHGSLRYWGQMGEAIPKIERRDFGGNPLAYFRKHYRGRKMKRVQLSKEDNTLYSALVRAKQIDEAIYEKTGVTYRGYESPLECFRDKYLGEKITRKQLRREDSRLYDTLRHRGQLDDAIPKGISEKEKLEVMLRRMTG